MSYSRRSNLEVPGDISKHFYSRLFVPCCTRKHGKYGQIKDIQWIQWEGIIEDHAENTRPKIVALAALAIASFGVALASEPVTGIVSAAIGLGISLFALTEVNKEINQIYPYCRTDGPKYW